MGFFKRVTSALLAMVMVIAMLPAPAMAETIREVPARVETAAPAAREPEAATEPVEEETGPAPETTAEAAVPVAKLTAKKTKEETGPAVSVAVPMGDPTPEDQFKYEVITTDGVKTVTITRYTGTDAHVVIPDQLGGYPVVKISSGAFYNNSSLESLVIPEGVTEIGGGTSYSTGAFSNCVKLTSISLPQSLTKIGQYAFYETGLTGVEIPGEAVVVGVCAFAYCESLAKVQVSGSLKSIGNSAFSGCSVLKEINLPAGLESIGDAAFSGSVIERLELPDTVTSITSSSMDGLEEALKHIRWSAGVPVVPYGTFYNFSALESVELPEGVTEIKSGSSWSTGVFSNCVKLTSVSLPKSLTTIGQYAFYEAGLTGVEIPGEAVVVGVCAFAHCESLTKVQVSGSLKSIGNSAFYGSSVLKEINLPAGLESIGDAAFSGSVIERLELPDTVTSITSSSMSGLGKALKHIRWSAGVPVVPYGTFYNFSALESVELPEGVTEIKSGSSWSTGVFSNCVKLTSISLPQSLTTIGQYAFYEAGLTGVEIPGEAVVVGVCAFAHCESLAKVQVSGSLKSIGNSAFSGCSVLKEINLPAGLESIGSSAFSGSIIERLELPDTVTSITSSSMDGLEEALKYIRWSAGVPVVPASTFSNFTALESVELPEGVTQIASGSSWSSGVFSNCVNLTTISLPQSLTTIGAYAFYNDSNVVMKVWPGSYSEDYAEENGYTYIYRTVGDAEINGVLTVTLNPVLYKGMQLVISVGDRQIIRTISSETAYTFTGLVIGAECAVSLRDRQGNPVAEAGPVSITEDTSVALEDVENLGSLVVSIRENNGTDRTADVQINWYDASGSLWATGAHVTGIPVGTVLTGRIVMEESFAKRFRLPDEIVHTVASGENRVQVTLTALGTHQLSGTVKDSRGSILSGATVIVDQNIHGRYPVRQIVTADKQGAFALDISAAGAQVTVHAKGYASETISLENMTENVDLGEIVMEVLSGAQVGLDVAYREILSDETGTALRHLEDLNIAIVNQTTGREVTAFQRQGMNLVITDGAGAGDRLEITLSSTDGSFDAVPVTVTLDEKQKASASVMLTLHGTVKFTLGQTQNETVLVLLYDSNGDLVHSQTVNGGDGTMEAVRLPNGQYTLVVMGGSEFFTVPNTLSGLSQADLVQGVDYISQTVKVSAGSVTEGAVEEIPLLDESRFLYTDPEATLFTCSKTTVPAGKFFTLRAHTAFTEEYASSVSDLQWVIELPEGTEYYSGTLTVDKLAVEYTQADNLILVPVEDPSLDLRLCVLVTGQGVVKPVVYIQFTHEGKTIRQPVGSVQVTIGVFDIEVTPRTYSPQVTVFGTGTSNTEIGVYDNGYLVGRTMVNSSGNWLLTFDLHNPGTISTHRISAEMEMPTGTKVRSKTLTVEYQYTPHPASVKTVTMYSRNDWGPTKTVLDFQSGEVIGGAYALYIYDPVLTFVIEFECDDMTRLSDVVAVLDLANGTTRELPAIYDAQQNAFVTSARFAKNVNALPQNLSVRYVCDGGLVLSEEHLAELRATEETLTEVVDEVQSRDESILQQIPLEELEDADLPDRLIIAITEYNRSLTEYEEEMKKLSNVVTSVYGDFQETENGFVTTGDYFDMTVEKRELDPFSLQAKIEEGYIICPAGDESDNAVLVHEIACPGYVERSTIDLDIDFDELARLLAGGAETELVTNGNIITQKQLLPADADLSSLIVQGGTEYYQSITEKSDNAGYYEDTLARLQEQNNSTFQAEQKLIQDWMEIAGYLVEDTIHDAAQEIQDETKDIILDALGIESPAEEGLEAVEEAIRSNPIMDGLLDTGDAMKNSIDSVPNFEEMNAIIAAGGAGSDYAKIAGWLYAAEGFSRYLAPSLTLIGGGLVKFPFPLAKGIGCGLLGVGALMPTLGNSTLRLANAVAKKAKSDYNGGANGGLFAPFINQKFPSGTNPMKAHIDPSGYVYEAVASNRLPGVTVTCYERVTMYDIYDEPYEEIRKWDATESGQMNPLVTDSMGRYAWDVPAGWWQVKAELDGYETTYSDWLPVPPPQLDVNLGMVSYAVPEIAQVYAKCGAVEITFSKYMRAESLTAGSITISVDGQRIPGKLELLNAEASPADPAQIFASKVKFIPNSPLEVGAAVEVRVSAAAVSYSDVAVAAGESAEAIVQNVPESITADDTVEIDYQADGRISIQALPADAAAGKTVTVSGGDSIIVAVQEQSVTLDDSGCAVVHITGTLPGEAELVFTMEGTGLSARTRVTVRMPEIHTHSYTAHVTAPTCTEQGYTTYTCSCGDSYTADYVAAADHSYVDGICTGCGAEEIPAHTVTYTSASISLAGDIGVNYYAQLSDGIVADKGAYMQFTVAGQTQTVPISEAVVNAGADGVITYRFSCKVAAKQMTESITGQMFLSDGTAVGDPKVYSVKAYCDAAIPVYSQYAAYADLVNLMKAMLNYGGYSQVQFGYNTGDLANAGLDIPLPAITASDVDAYAHGATGSEAGISVASVSLLLESTTTIRFYFKLDGSKPIEQYRFYVDGVETTPVEANGQYYVDKVNVAAKDLDEMVTVTIGGLTVRYCGLSYVRQVAVLYPTYYSAALVNVAKALYAYNRAANAYFA